MGRHHYPGFHRLAVQGSRDATRWQRWRLAVAGWQAVPSSASPGPLDWLNNGTATPTPEPEALYVVTVPEGMVYLVHGGDLASTPVAKPSEHVEV